MKQRPILFSGPMVRALLSGAKTQTRRAVKLEIPADADEVFYWTGDDLRREGFSNVAETGLWARKNGRNGYLRFIGRCPYGAAGDRLWVRESGLEHRRVQLFIHDATPGHWWTSADGGRRGASYNVDGISRQQLLRDHRVRPSIHMPRWASRLTLEVSDIRAERLHAITEDDAEAEGVQEPSLVPKLGAFWSSRDGFARLWESINGAGSWAANPWVWAVTFRKVEDQD